MIVDCRGMSGVAETDVVWWLVWVWVGDGVFFVLLWGLGWADVAGQQDRFESARKRLQEGYANEKAKRDSRTVRVLSGPVAKGRRGATVSTAASQSTVGRAQLAQRRLQSIASHRSVSTSSVARRSAPPDARRMLPTSRNQLPARRPAPSLNNMYVVYSTYCCFFPGVAVCDECVSRSNVLAIVAFSGPQTRGIASAS